MPRSKPSPARDRTRKDKAGSTATAAKATAAPRDAARTVAWWAIAIVLLGTAWALDPFADDAFDAPKRLIALLGAGLGGVALLWQAPSPINWRAWPGVAKWILLAAAAGVVFVCVSALVSTHPDLAWPNLRRFILMALFAMLGASRALDGSAGVRLFAVFLLACITNALISLAQSGGLELLPIASVGGRFATGALLGNEGYVAIACAMMAAASTACAVNVHGRARIGFALIAVLGLLVIALNQQKTSAIALAVALLVIAATRWRKPWLLAGFSVLLAFALTGALLPPVRAATWGRLPLPTYQQLTTYRLGAWIAAADMAAERPLSGFGPGAFAPEAQTHRLAAELRQRERLTMPTAASFVYAHQDYLQLASECGIPALLLFLGAIVALFAALVRQTPSLEQQVVLAISATGMIVALGWFPMHIPFTACVLLLCAGRAWRLVAMPSQVQR